MAISGRLNIMPSSSFSAMHRHSLVVPSSTGPSFIDFERSLALEEQKFQNYGMSRKLRTQQTSDWWRKCISSTEILFEQVGGFSSLKILKTLITDTSSRSKWDISLQAWSSPGSRRSWYKMLESGMVRHNAAQSICSNDRRSRLASPKTQSMGESLQLSG